MIMIMTLMIMIIRRDPSVRKPLRLLYRFIAVMATREMLRGSDIDRDLEELDALMPAQHERNLFSKCCLCSPTPSVAWAAVDDGKVDDKDTHLCVQQQDYYLKAE